MSKRPALGIGLMLLGILLFSLNDTLGKWLVATYSVGQVLLVRSAAAFIVLAPFLYRRGAWTVLHPQQVGLQVLRAGFSTVELLLFYWAVVYLPLVDAIAYYLAAPIYVAALSPWLLGERIGWQHWVAILAGFCGVLIALDPSSAALSAPAFIAIAGSLFFALMMVTGRKLRSVPDLALVFGQTAGGLLAGAATVGTGWVGTQPSDLVLIGLVGIVALCAHLCINRSLKLADAALVSPFQYMLLVWAILFGYVFFGDTPRFSMLLGALVIVTAGLFILLDGRRRAGRAEKPRLEKDASHPVLNP